ncbi:MAG TPA: outer membrane beta-barrel protein [Bradyrhizobium sp.]|nr:outer membrane beta-barrel protein [Bradyrhizobium sp.]
MRRFLLAAVMCGCVSAANAADLPILRGGFTDGLTTSNVNWEGFYIGGQAGYGSSDENFTGSNANMIAALLDHNVIQEMQVSSWNLGMGKQSARTSAFGAFTGYNWQWDDVVLGLDASWMHGSFGGTSSAFKSLVSGAALSDGNFHDVAVTSSSSISISDMATFRGRAAYAFGSFLPYAFGGFALGNADIVHSVSIHDQYAPTYAAATASCSSGTPPVCYTLAASDAQHNHLIYGYTAGLGIDINIVGGLFVRAEYEYVRFTTSVDTSINTVRAGLGYKF